MDNLILFVDKYALFLWYLSGLIGTGICIYYLNRLADETYPLRKWLILLFTGALLGLIVFIMGMFILGIVLLLWMFSVKPEDTIECTEMCDHCDPALKSICKQRKS